MKKTENFIQFLKEDEEMFGEYAYLYMNKVSFPEKIRPIGYQPFTRCHKQRGYFIDTNEDNNIRSFGLSKVHNFTKHKFKRNDKLTLELVHQFDYGNLIYPSFEKNTLTKIVHTIEKERRFTYHEISELNKHMEKKYSSKEVIDEMKRLEYAVMDKVKRSYLNDKITFISFDDYLKRENINITTRLVYKPPIK